MPIVNLTKPQADWVDWALSGPMAQWDEPEDLAWDHAVTIEAARLAIATRDAIRLDGTTLYLPDGVTAEDEAIENLISMLEGLAPDITLDAGEEQFLGDGHSNETAHLIAVSKATCAVNAATRIREAIES